MHCISNNYRVSRTQKYWNPFGCISFMIKFVLKCFLLLFRGVNWYFCIPGRNAVCCMLCALYLCPSVILTAGRWGETRQSASCWGGNRSLVVYLHPLLKFAFCLCLPLSTAFVLWIGFVVLPIIAAVAAVVVGLLVYWWQLQLGVQLGHIYIRCTLFTSRFFLPFLVKLQPAEVKDHHIGLILISIFTDLCMQFNWLAIIDISLQIYHSNLIDLQLSTLITRFICSSFVWIIIEKEFYWLRLTFNDKKL